MKKSFFTALAVLLVSATALQAQTSGSSGTTSGQNKTRKVDSSSYHNGSYSISGASKNEVRGAAGQNNTGATGNTGKKTRVKSPPPNNTNSTDGSNISPNGK